jgi:sec-independent protein translocase protein TatC
LVIAFGFCFWQNQRLLDALNRALPATPATSQNHISGLTGDSVNERKGLLKAAAADKQLAASTANPALKQSYLQAAAGLTEAAQALPSSTGKRLPITIGVGEPFTTTLTVAAYFALLITLPVLLYQVYAFVIPALSPEEKSVALPAMLAAPALFLAGAAFAYFFVLPPAVHFLQGYNSQNFDILVQAKTYYKFQIFTMLGVGLAFQLPLALLALHRLGVINGSTLTKHWRYATVIMAVIAAAMPGADPVSTAFEMLPLVVLYFASIVMLKIADRRAAARVAAESSSSLPEGLDPT